MTSDIRDTVINSLTLESLKILKEAAKEKPGANGGYYAWLQQVITQAEDSGNESRAIAGVIVMKACGEALGSKDKDFVSLVMQGVQQMVDG